MSDNAGMSDPRAYRGFAWPPPGPLTFIGGSRDGEYTDWLGAHVDEDDVQNYIAVPDRFGRWLYVLVDSDALCMCMECAMCEEGDDDRA